MIVSVFSPRISILTSPISSRSFLSNCVTIVLSGAIHNGAARVIDLVKAAVEHKMKAVALTDHGNLFGAIEFYKEAKANGIKPIIGMEAYITIDGDRFSRSMSSDENDYNGKAKRPKHYNHLILIAKNQIGFKN